VAVPLMPAQVAVPRRALVLLAVLTLIWGTNWPLFPLAMSEMSVWTFRAISVPVSGMVMLAVAALRGMPLGVPRADWPRLVAATCAYLVVWNIGSAYAAIMIPSGQSAVLAFTMPLWSALISWMVLGERMSRRLVLALALGVAAVLLLMVPNFGAYAGAPLGMVAGLVAAVGWAIGTLIIKRHRWESPVLVLTAWQMLLTSVPLVPSAFAFGDGHWFMPSWQTIWVVAYITLVPMCIGNVTWFAVVGLLPASIAGLSSVMVPVVAMISGALVHGEPLGPLQVTAMLFSVVSLSLALLKPAGR
jgi:drug/metabolite transporter (DMT)-like permease